MDNESRVIAVLRTSPPEGHWTIEGLALSTNLSPKQVEITVNNLIRTGKVNVYRIPKRQKWLVLFERVVEVTCYALK